MIEVGKRYEHTWKTLSKGEIKTTAFNVIEQSSSGYLVQYDSGNTGLVCYDSKREHESVPVIEAKIGS